MVAHKTPGVDLPVGLQASFPEGVQEQKPILVAIEDRFAAVSAVHHVVDRSWILRSEFASHLATRGCMARRESQGLMKKYDFYNLETVEKPCSDPDTRNLIEVSQPQARVRASRTTSQPG
jgi:hypothetical protein